MIAALKALGKKCHLILANGAFRPPTNDENKAMRTELRSIVDLHDRLGSGNHFAHNKFVVCCDSRGTPRRVLFGSTNWTMTGLCQANNGIIVDSPDLAADFLAEWNLLKSAGNAYPPTLATANSTSKSFNIDGGRSRRRNAKQPKEKAGQEIEQEIQQEIQQEIEGKKSRCKKENADEKETAGEEKSGQKINQEIRRSPQRNSTDAGVRRSRCSVSESAVGVSRWPRALS